MIVAVCPGTFDPITNGHLDIIGRATDIYDKIVVGVAENPVKKTLFTLEERLRLARISLAEFPKVEVQAFSSLLVEFAQKQQAKVIIKGLRAVSDFEHELQMAHLNKRLNSEIETIFMMASPEYMYLSSSAVKEIAMYGGDITGLVPDVVKEELKLKYKHLS